MSRADSSDPAIAAAIAEMKAPGTSTDWMLLGYVPKSDTKLRLLEKGSGGLSAMADNLNDGNIYYAFVAFNVNNTQKFVYISWCGEGVTGMKKRSFQ